MIIFLAVIIVACISAYLLYRDCFGLLICGIGTFSNFLVIAANGWRMPVKVDNAHDYLNIVHNLGYKYIVLDKSVKLGFLADVIRFNGLDLIFSLGDAIISAGIVWTIIYLALEIVRSIKRKKRIIELS